MAEANITKLARVVPGELSPDQAVIDYAYYEPALFLQDILSEGFFNQLSPELTLYSRVSVYCLAENSGSVPASLTRFDLVVILKEPIPYKNYDRIKVVPLPGVWQDTAEPDVWSVPTLKYQGMVKWTPPANTQANTVLVPNVRVDFVVQDVVLFNQPNCPGEVNEHLIQVVCVSGPNQLQIKWAATWPGGVESFNIAGGQALSIYVEVWGDLVL